MQEYCLEIAKEIKSNAEVGGRAMPNLIDALNASYDYGYTKESQMEHIKNSRLTYLPVQSPANHVPSIKSMKPQHENVADTETIRVPY